MRLAPLERRIVGRETLEAHEIMEAEDFESPSRRVLGTRIALTVGVLATVLSLATREAERTAAECLLAKNDAVLAQSRASDEWGYRQAKSIKLHLLELAPGGVADVEQIRADIVASEARAREAEQQRDEANRRSTESFEAHHAYARASSLLQIAIVLESVAAVLGRRTLWWVGMGVGTVASALLAWMWLGLPR